MFLYSGMKSATACNTEMPFEDRSGARAANGWQRKFNGKRRGEEPLPVCAR